MTAAAPRSARPRAAAPAALRAAAALGALALLSGCESVGGLWGDTPDVEFSVLGPSTEPEEKPSYTYEVKERRPVLTVEVLEVGRTHNGVTLTAYGLAPHQDWFSPLLQPRRDGLPGPDGFIEFDFLAAPPELNQWPYADPYEPGAPGDAQQRRVRGDAEIPAANLALAAGLRVHAAGAARAIRLTPGG